MITTPIGTETIDLLSRITGQKLSQRDITPQLVFLATLVTILSGVIYADGTVTEEEKQRLQKTLNQFVSDGDDLHQLTQLIITGVGQQEIYNNPRELMPLIDSLSKAQRLLITALGYEIATADSNLNVAEQKYLQIAADCLSISSKHLKVLDAIFSNQQNVETDDLFEVNSLMYTARQFHELDALFVKAASELVSMLPNETEHKAAQQDFSTYQQLNDFQKHRQQLDSLCLQIYNIIKDCTDRKFLPNTLIKRIEAISKKLQSQRFRVAVIGEFGQGKSTLLNALLSQEIQPVRAVPCTGTITVFRYGKQQRIICHYKDGREEEILFEEYQKKAVISKQVAINNRIEDIERSDIEEITFEHPNFTLCKSGVEIIDSPGLNEHPQRTAITQKLLKDADAVIFLINASRLLSETERKLLQDVRVQLNGGKESKPAENLFILVNFMDLLGNEEDRTDVKQRLDNFIKSKGKLVKGKNRIQYISAKTALESIMNGTKNEYSKSFQDFTNHLEQFLVFEKGKTKISQSVPRINKLLNLSLNELEQVTNILDEQNNLFKIEKQYIIEKIGEASGRDFKISQLGKQTFEQTTQEAEEAWDKWQKGLKNCLTKKSQNWTSLHNYVSQPKDLIEDYINCFNRDLKKEINDWENKELGDRILKRNIKILTVKIKLELKELKVYSQDTRQQAESNVYDDHTIFSDTHINDDIAGRFIGGLGIGGALAAGLLVFTGLGLIAILIASTTAAIAGFLGIGMLDFAVIIKNKVVELGFQNFEASKDKIFENLSKIVESEIENKVQATSHEIKQAILRHENLLEQQDNVHQETLEQRNADETWIAQKCEELKQLQIKIDKEYS